MVSEWQTADNRVKHLGKATDKGGDRRALRKERENLQDTHSHGFLFSFSGRSFG